MSHALRTRLAFLLETVALEVQHLQATDARLFAEACRTYAEARGLVGA